MLTNADAEGKELKGSMFGSSFGNQNFKGISFVPNLIVSVPCTLNELYNGCSKLVQYERTALNADGRTTSQIIESKYYLGI
jgi:hypothetical protein